MKLTDTFETLTAQPGEAHEHVAGPRIVPENEIEADALRQIWDAQRCKQWSMENRDIPYDSACFAECKMTKEGFGETWIQFENKEFDPLALMDAPLVPVTIYYLWEYGKIQAYWSIVAGEYNTAQYNQAQCYAVFR